jgi:hypothetical protein
MFNWMSRKFFIRVILLMVIASYGLKLFGVSYITDTLMLGMVAHSIALIGLNAWENKRGEG